MTTLFSITPTTNVRVWTGIGGALENATDTPTQGCWFRYSTSASDTDWMCVTANGSTQTIIDSGVPADTNFHTFQIDYTNPGTSCKFYIDGTLVGTSTTHLPTAGTEVGYATTITSLSTANQYLNFAKAYYEYY